MLLKKSLPIQVASPLNNYLKSQRLGARGSIVIPDYFFYNTGAHLIDNVFIKGLYIQKI